MLTYGQAIAFRGVVGQTHTGRLTTVGTHSKTSVSCVVNHTRNIFVIFGGCRHVARIARALGHSSGLVIVTLVGSCTQLVGGVRRSRGEQTCLDDGSCTLALSSKGHAYEAERHGVVGASVLGGTRATFGFFRGRQHGRLLAINRGRDICGVGFLYRQRLYGLMSVGSTRHGKGELFFWSHTLAVKTVTNYRGLLCLPANPVTYALLVTTFRVICSTLGLNVMNAYTMGVFALRFRLFTTNSMRGHVVHFLKRIAGKYIRDGAMFLARYLVMRFNCYTTINV